LIQPLVSICIPTFNRAQKLARAVENAIGQDYENLEIIVSDNASSDQTRQLIAEYMQQDPRIRYVRKDSNEGLVSNFNDSIRLASGAYRMWLADDDWLDSNFISSGVSALIADPDLVMVAGQCKVYRKDESVETARAININNASPVHRVIKHYATVTDNSGFYGLYKAEVVTAIKIAEHQISSDWQFLAAIALLGKIATVNGTYIHRDGDTGASGNLREYARQLGLPRLFQYEPYLAAAFEACNDIAHDNDVYCGYSALQRRSLALLIFCLIVLNKILARRAYRALRAFILPVSRLLRV
jgi:glycosyltransferase involved in cell wall biosynthesis